MSFQDRCLSSASKSVWGPESFRAPSRNFPAGGNRRNIIFRSDFSLYRPIEEAATPRPGLIVGTSRRSGTNTATSDPVRRSIRTETSARRVCRARISAASAWASTPDISCNMPEARPERACGEQAAMAPRFLLGMRLPHQDRHSQRDHPYLLPCGRS